MKFNKSNLWMFSIKFFLLLLLAANTFASDNILISQVYPDPFSSEFNGEVVELFNPTKYVVDLSGFQLMTTSSVGDVVVPNGMKILSGGYFLIADTGYGLEKDNITWPNADYEEDMTLANSDGGLVLMDSDLNIVDAVGWGNPPNSTFFEGKALPNPETGKSFFRLFDTGNNSGDFVLSEPLFRNSSLSFSSRLMRFNVNVAEPDPEIYQIIFEDDFSEYGHQVMPYPKMNRTVLMRLILDNHYSINHSLTISYFDSLIEIDADNRLEYGYDFNGTHDFYNLSVVIPYYTLPDNYSVNISVQNDEEVFSSKVFNYTVMPVAAFEMDSTVLDCAVVPGETCLIDGDSDMNSTESPTIHNIGNTMLDFTAVSYDNGIGYPPDNVFVSYDNFNTNQSLSSGYHFDVNLMPDDYLPVSVLFRASQNMTAGNYTSLINIEAVQ